MRHTRKKKVPSRHPPHHPAAIFLFRHVSRLYIHALQRSRPSSTPSSARAHAPSSDHLTRQRNHRHIRKNQTTTGRCPTTSEKGRSGRFFSLSGKLSQMTTICRITPNTAPDIVAKQQLSINHFINPPILFTFVSLKVSERPTPPLPTEPRFRFVSDFSDTSSTGL